MSGGSTAPIKISQESMIHQELKVDTFSLMVNYPDPFLDQQDSLMDEALDPEQGKAKGLTQTPGLRPVNVSPPVVFNPGDLKYTGYIGNSNTKQRTGIVTYKGAEYMVRINDKVDLWKVVSIASKSLKVKADGQNYTINMEN